jgi:hypothetical protein
MTLSEAIDTLNQSAYDRGFTRIECDALQKVLAAAMRPGSASDPEPVAAMMPALWALGHMPETWGPLPGVGSNWGWLLEQGYIESNTHPGPHHLQVRITEKGWAILLMRPPGRAALDAALQAEAGRAG